MSAISAIAAQPSYTQKNEALPPSPTTKPVDSDGDHDNGRVDQPASGGRLRITA